jgi:hypothetical protein
VSPAAFITAWGGSRMMFLLSPRLERLDKCLGFSSEDDREE